jgi:regulator of RNase E activity RraA
LPVFSRRLFAVPAPPYVINMDVNLPIHCGNVLVVPGDIILADDDGVVVIPASLAEKVAEAATENEEVEAFMRTKVEAGLRICDIYPPSPAMQQELAAFRARYRQA